MNDDVRLAKLEERIDNWMKTTTDYRATLCEKIADLKSGQLKVFGILYDLPCKERGEIYKGFERTLLYFKIAIGFTVALLIAHLGWAR